MRSILEYLERTAEKGNPASGVEDELTCMSWKEILETSQKVGTSFSKITGPGKPVVILMKKSMAALSAMLGTVYAGCFYSVLDPEQPQERIREIFRVLSPEIVVLENTEDEKVLEKISYTGQRVVLKDCLKEKADKTALRQIREGCRDTDILYCMFTSGSTGTPKGIIVSHRAVVRFISHFTDIFHISEQDRIGNQAPFDFDVSVKDIYSCVMTGASLVLVPQKLFTTPSRLVDYMCVKRITTLIWAVSALTLISSLKGLQYRVPMYVKKVLFSGEVMPPGQLLLWQRALPDAEFINLYGPTEITCNCTYYRIDRTYQEQEKIPIGRPFPEREVFLLNDRGEYILEKNKTGEICVAGESLSSGYYHLSEETDKRFRRKEDGQVYYKTGDLGYWGSDAELYFVGRKDFQVKIMGRRIELEDVEHAINQIDGVERTCCLLNKNRSSLVAYFSGSADDRIMRRQLRKKLPSYMIPQKVIRLQKLPMNKNGKIDRSKLQALQGAAL